MKKYKTISKVLAVLLLVSTMVSLLPEPVHAANTKIRQEINILDGYLGAPSGSFATSSEVINIDSSKYSGATFYFEVVASTSATLSTQFFLRNATSGAAISTITIPTGTTAYTRFRSAAFTPQTGSTDYVAVVASTTGATKGLIAARVIVLQDTSSLANTQTQIEIGNNENYTSTATSSLASPKYWYYDSTKWAGGSPTFYAEVTYGRLIDTYVGSSTTYSTSGTRTQVIPSNIASTTIVELWGGGGGGGAASTNTTGSGSGGAGGQYAKKTIASLAGTSKTLVVGAFGPGGVSTAGGTAGGDSTWDTNVVVAKGGAGGGANSGTAGAGSATGGVGDTVNAGGSGRAGVSGGASGGGGGGAGSTGTGGAAGVAPAAGTGTSVGGGNGGTGQSTNGTPAAASNAGGGGAGGRSTGSPNVNGGNGGVGMATITFNLLQNATTTIVLQEDDGSFANWTDKVYIVSEGTASSSSRVRSSAFTPTSGRNYRIAVKEGYSGATHQIYNAKIIVNQSAGGSFSSSTYDNKSFLTTSQTTTSHSVEFKADGTKMYLVSRTGTFIYQYSLSTPWDVTTASYDSITFSQSTDGTGSDVYFKPDGTKMYFIGTGNDTVYQYTLGTAWNVSTASYDNVSFSVATQATSPWSFYMSDDGTKLYALDQTNDTVYQYSLSSAWDISSASYASISKYIGGEESIPAGLSFSSDGFTMYVGGQSVDGVSKYTLSTAWDVSTASYVENFSMANENTDLHNIFISSDGTHMYGIHNGNDTIYQYTIPSGSVTKLEPQMLIANTKLASGTSLQNFRTYWNPAEWAVDTSIDYFHEANGVAAGTSDVKLQERTSSGDLSGSTITDLIQRERSSSIKTALEALSARDIDVIATTNNNDIYSSRVIVQVDASPVVTTTVGDGTDGGNSTIGPGGSATEIDRFSVVTNTGTDSVTDLTVQILPAAATTTIATVGVYDTSGNLKCSATPSGSNSVNISSCTGISASTNSAEYVIKITPKSHANMPAVPGTSYAVTATTTDITVTGLKSVSDTDSATITVDNASPANVTSGNVSSIYQGRTTISWVIPGDGDFSSVIVLRKTGSAITDVPTEGGTYNVGDPLGSSTVVCNTASNSCEESGVTAGTYYYKTFTVDTRGNYSSGASVTGSPYTLQDSTYTQQAYRFFNSANSVTPGSALANQDTAATLGAAGDHFRLRMLMRVDTNGMYTNGQNFKLQYAQKSGTCDASFTGETYIDVDTGNDIEYYDEPSIGNGSAIGSQADLSDSARTIVDQTYVEGFPFLNETEVILSGEDGKWDFSLHDFLGQDGVSYCFRIVEEDGTLLNSYTLIPELTVPAAAPQISQLHYRWRNDFYNESSSNGFISNEDTSLSNSDIDIGDRLRLRFLIKNTAGSATGYNYRLETASTSCVAWYQVASSTTGGSPHWLMDTSTKLSNGAATTNNTNLTDPTGSFVAGYVMTQDSQTPSLSLTSGQFTELEYSIRSTSVATRNTTYCFRLTNSGVTTGFTFSQQPQIILPAVAIINRARGGGNAGGEGSGSGSLINGGNTGGGGGSTGGSGGGQGQTGGGSGGGGGDTGMLLLNRFFAVYLRPFILNNNKITLGYLLKLR